MTRPNHVHESVSRLRTAIVTALLLSGHAAAQTPFAGEDFDGNQLLAGPATFSVSPDNSASTPPGSFSSFFDWFGVTRRIPATPPDEGDNLPFALVDDSLGDNPGDDRGIIGVSKTDSFFALSDLDNNDNESGEGAATWTFDISGRSNLALGIDLAMIGNFEGTDSFTFQYSIDGGATRTAFVATGDESAEIPFYDVTLENGVTTDRFTNGFFDSDAWDQLVAAGEPVFGIEFHDADNGMDGDSVARDGFIPVEFLTETVEVRANRDGNFLETEFEEYEDRLYLNGDSTTGTPLTNQLTTYTAPIIGAGDTLTLEFLAANNGGDEWFVFDNIVLSEGAGQPGDFNGDGRVDAADYAVLRDSSADVLTDYDAFAANFGAEAGLVAASSSVVPEPASALLLAAAFAGVFGRGSKPRR